MEKPLWDKKTKETNLYYIQVKRKNCFFTLCFLALTQPLLSNSSLRGLHCSTQCWTVGAFLCTALLSSFLSGTLPCKICLWPGCMPLCVCIALTLAGSVWMTLLHCELEIAFRQQAYVILVFTYFLPFLWQCDPLLFFVQHLKAVVFMYFFYCLSKEG